MGGAGGAIRGSGASRDAPLGSGASRGAVPLESGASRGARGTGASLGCVEAGSGAIRGDEIGGRGAGDAAEGVIRLGRGSALLTVTSPSPSRGSAAGAA